MARDDIVRIWTALRSRRPLTRLETSDTRTGRPRWCLRQSTAAGRRVKAISRKTRAHVTEESDNGRVPMNHSNKDGKLFAESEEGRPLIKENIRQPNTYPTQSEKHVSHGLMNVRKAAKGNKEMKFTALLHHLTIDLLRESFYALKRKAAPGVDGVTWQEYATGLEDRLKDLHGRGHRGAYREQASKRRWIPKGNGKQRPLGIAALEDKIVQQAVVTVLNEIYEEDFRGFSYGFRPGRSQHMALDALYVAIKRKRVSWILDLDLKSFFDNISHEKLVQLIEKRIADPRILRLIQKWLKAGVMEDGVWSETEAGTPQGAVVSPLLSNVYLHYVLDQWTDQWRQAARGEITIVRYADDAILGFERQDEAERYLRELKEHLREYGLELNEDKTRLIRFGRFARLNRAERGEGT